MGLFNRPRKPLEIQHSIFGTLQYHSSKDGTDSYYEGQSSFVIDAHNHKRTINFVVYAASDGPTPAQQVLYQKLQRDFSAYVAKMIPMVEREFGLWGKNIVIKDFDKEFTVVLLSMQQEGEPPLKWQVILDTIHDTNHQIIVDFAGDEPLDILFDV